MKTISIIHPSRGRAGMAHETALKWIDASENKNIEYIISIDNDDPQLPIYKALFKDGFKVVRNRNKNVVQAMNYGARFASNKIFVCISDDFEPCHQWDKLIDEAITSDLQALQVGDGITNLPTSAYVRKFNEKELIMTLPIITKKLYEMLGYIYYPEYSGMFADNDLALVCNHLGVLKYCPEIIFKHNHFTNGLAKMDATYMRHNTRQSWVLGEQIIAKRKANDFGFPKNN